jgi:CRISPR/Cas system CSM-associated protein Csm3 (group 7 of RAMP superfamily)
MLEQVFFTAQLRLLSDLHIGTGDKKKLPEIRQKPHGMEEDPEVALIVRAANGTAVIPATALKGALRKAVLAAHGKDIAERLFGATKDTKWEGDRYVDEGQIGTVWLRFARMMNLLGAGDRPFWDRAQQTIVTTHVAIERKTGTAAKQKLFYVERVPGGADFELRGVYVGTRAEAERDLPIAFGALVRPDGLGLGADGKAGGGRIGFAKAVLDCRRRYFDDKTGDIRDEGPFEIAIVLASADMTAVRGVKLTIFCRGPYLTIDPAKPRGGNVIPAARRNDTAPLLPASGLLGVLRTRVAWLAATDAIGDGDDLDRILTTGEDPRTLTRTQRLFGVAGWRGLVRVVDIAAINDSRCERLPSVVIDRFSGGTLDSALYETEAFARVRFAITLQLDRRQWDKKTWPSNADVALFDALLDDLCDEGLMLGHGVNRGFGWFEVTRA